MLDQSDAHGRGMSRLGVHAFSLSIDGYGVEPNQSIDHPLGVGGPAGCARIGRYLR